MFVDTLNGCGQGRRPSPIAAPERKVILAALGERDAEAAICRDRKGNPEPDTEFRDTETVPLRENVVEYIAREVLPHVPDAWVDESKTKIGLRDSPQPPLLRVRAAPSAGRDRVGPARAGAGDRGPAHRDREELTHG